MAAALGDAFALAGLYFSVILSKFDVEESLIQRPAAFDELWRRAGVGPMTDADEAGPGPEGSEGRLQSRSEEARAGTLSPEDQLC